MSKWLLNTIGLAVLAALGFASWGGWCLYPHVTGFLDKWQAAAPDLKPTVEKANAVLDHLNRPCKGVEGPDACGTLAQINKTVIKAGDAVVTTQLFERATLPHVTGAMDEFGIAAKHLSGTADELSGTARALAGTAQGATDTLAEGKRTIAAAQPLLASYTTAGDSLNELLKRRAIGETLDNLAGITGHANALMDDGQRVGDDLTRRYFSPVPWYKKVGPFAEFGVKAANKTFGLW